MYDLEKRINDAVFPGLQGGPHDNVIAGLYHCCNHWTYSFSYSHMSLFLLLILTFFALQTAL